MRRLIAVTAFSLLGAGVVAQASVVTFSDRSTWLAASTGVTTIAFEGLAAPGTFVEYPTPPGLTLDGVTFDTDPATLLYVVDPAYFPNYSRGSGANLDWQIGTTFPTTLATTLPPGTSAFGADFFSLVNSSSLLLTLSTGESFLIPAPGNGDGMSFFGVTSSSSVSWMTVTQAPGELEPYYGLDNFSFGVAGEPGAVPEPSAVVLLGAGLLAVVARRRSSAPHGKPKDSLPSLTGR